MNVLLSLWRLLNRRQRRRLVALQFLSVLMAFTTVGGIAAIQPFFSVLTQPDAIDRSPLLHFFYTRFHFSGEREFLLALGCAFAAVVLIANAVNVLGMLVMNRFAFRVGETFQVALFREYLRRGCAFRASTNSATLSSNVLYESARVTGGILQSGLVLITNVVTTVCIIASILFVSPGIALSAIAGLGASYALIYLGTRRRLLRNGRAETRALAARSKIVTEGFGALKEITLLRGQQLFVDAFARHCRSFASSTTSTLAISQAPRHVIEVIMVCGLVAMALHATSGSEGAGSWVAQVSFIGLAAYRLLPALQQAFASMVKIRAERPAFDGIAADLRSALAAPHVEVPAAAADRAWRGRPRREILLEGVSYHHAAGRPAAVANVTLRIPAGAFVGFVGPTVPGKTTLMDLVSGLLVPQSVACSSMALLSMTRTAVPGNQSLRMSHRSVFLLDASVSENVALGVRPEHIDAERVRSAVRLARLEECVAALPKGYDETLGERGCRLSGGQRQRLGVARALYREASVLMMDEITSALDVVAEQEIIDMLLTLREGRTILLIAHRPSSLRHCDVLFELDAGRVVDANALVTPDLRHRNDRLYGQP